MDLMDEEAKNYDAKNIIAEIQNNTYDIVKAIYKEQRNIIFDEEKHIRKLDEVECLNEHVKDDFEWAKQTGED